MPGPKCVCANSLIQGFMMKTIIQGLFFCRIGSSFRQNQIRPFLSYYWSRSCHHLQAQLRNGERGMVEKKLEIRNWISRLNRRLRRLRLHFIRSLFFTSSNGVMILSPPQKGHAAFVARSVLHFGQSCLQQGTKREAQGFLQTRQV